MICSRAPLLCAALVVTASCASRAAVTAIDQPPAALSSQPPERTTAPGESPRDAGSAPHEELTAAVAALMSDSRFQQRFAESYLASTSVEPPITSQELEHLQEVLLAMSNEDLEGAATLLQGMITPQASAVLDFTLGNIRFQQERLPEAAAAYASAIDKFPKFRRALKNIGLLSIRQGHLDEASQPLSRVIALGGGDALTYGLLGYAHSGNGQPVAAESAYRMAILLDPDTIDWQMGLARSFFSLERYGDAVALCASLIDQHPERADLWLLQANAYIGLAQPLKAAENYEFVDRLGGSTVDSLNMLGDIYVNDGLDDIAVDRYIRALTLDSKGGIQRPLRAARVLTSHGAFDETRQLIAGIESTRDTELQPDDQIELLKLRSRIAVAEGDDSEEVSTLEQLVELDPLDGEALILLGQHAARTAMPEKAAFYYERAASLEDFEADAKMRHAQLLVGEERYDEALPLLRRSLALKPSSHLQEFLEQVERVARRRS